MSKFRISNDLFRLNTTRTYRRETLPSSKALYKKISKQPIRPLNGEEIVLLQNELDRNGILDIQKTPNLPYKNIVRKAVCPWCRDVIE